jgi:hypothetical protein
MIVTVLLTMSVVSLHPLAGTANSGVDGGTGHGQKQALHWTARDQSKFKHTGNSGILIHINPGMIHIYFMSQLSGATSIEYIQKVVLSSIADGCVDQCSL